MTIVFCLPGASFSGKFLQAWSQLLVWCTGNGITPILCQYSNPNVYFVRNMCLGADVMRGPQQKPFNGTLNYDYLMWIDSDVLFTVEQFARIVKHGADILSAVLLIRVARLSWNLHQFWSGRWVKSPPSDQPASYDTTCNPKVRAYLAWPAVLCRPTRALNSDGAACIGPRATPTTPQAVTASARTPC